ncbi:hypothetical protein [Streptomyces panaciradicis]|uniref:hypothetical protein n=1 Tax=Streptomyces panaciradicis TaxID=1470261 RepID=UPI00201CD2D0|nr:hypothetical protein [Streptomyces panaciradicis]MCL6671553.1 hypothetical protein [Streptomyces panaciradicis]
METRHTVTGGLRPGGLGLHSSVRSRWRGRRDGSRLRMTLPDQNPDSAELITPYVQEVRLMAVRTTTELRARLLRDRHALVAGIHSGVVAVITQYEVRRSPSPALLDRWGRSVAEWRTAAAQCRTRAESDVAGANLRLAHYWDAVWRRQCAVDGNRRVRPNSWLPGQITLDPGWQDYDSWLAAAPGAPSALTRALNLLDLGHSSTGAQAA